MDKRFSYFNPSRRHILQGAAAAGITALGVPIAARAASKGRIVVGTSGGDYKTLTDTYIEQPHLVPAGWNVVDDVNDDLARRSKMLAEAQLPRGTSDVQGL